MELQQLTRRGWPSKSLVRSVRESLLDSQRTANDRTVSLEAFEIRCAFHRAPAASFTPGIVLGNSYMRIPCRSRIVLAFVYEERLIPVDPTVSTPATPDARRIPAVETGVVGATHFPEFSSRTSIEDTAATQRCCLVRYRGELPPGAKPALFRHLPQRSARC